MRPSRFRPPSLGLAARLLIILTSACTATPRVAPAPRPADSTAIAYGTQATRDVATAIASVDGDVARRSAPTTMADMLDGRFAGVDVRRLPSGGISVRIRGQRSLKADNEPLFVVDGIPQHAGTPGVLADLDPRDVARIEVLKDAGATAAYGARGANGVILIFTRRPE